MDYTQASDVELWQCCREDDMQAYNELVARYIPRLGRLIHSIIKDPFVTEEMVMDLLFNLWERRHTLQIKVSVSAYLFRACKYMTIRYLRTSLPETVPLSDLHEHMQPTSRKAEADYTLRYKEAEKDFDHKLTRLSPQRRRVFELSRKEHLTYKEIAQKMNLSVKTVESYMVSALAYMRKQYSDHPEYLILLIASVPIPLFI